LFEIEVRNISRTFSSTVALKNVTLLFEAGVIHGIIGPEAAGKTTLLRTLLGLLDCKEGEVIYRREGRQFNIREIRNLVAYMPEKQSLYGDLSIMEHLHFFKNLYGINDNVFKEKCSCLLNLTRHEQFVDRPAGKLSGGMYKKLGLMCALLRNPAVVVLDEPTNGVDPISRREFWGLLHDLSRESHITVIMTTSYMDEAERCIKVHLLESGRVVACGEPQNLIKQYGVEDFNELFIKKVTHNE
jgi:ABC-2 type transport system ATP-binding protein